jgi:hypothetical protein
MTKRAVTSWADGVMHGLSESEAKGWQALDFYEANAIAEFEMQHYVLSDAVMTLSSFRLPNSRCNVIDDVASDCIVMSPF